MLALAVSYTIDHAYSSGRSIVPARATTNGQSLLSSYAAMGGSESFLPSYLFWGVGVQFHSGQPVLSRFSDRRHYSRSSCPISNRVRVGLL